MIIMIGSFGDKETEKIYNQEFSKNFLSFHLVIVLKFQ